MLIKRLYLGKLLKQSLFNFIINKNISKNKIKKKPNKSLFDF